jgi:hypothetical protein
VEEAAELAAWEEAAHAAARAEELVEEAAADVVMQEEMDRERRRWDNDMAVARHFREVQELATQRHHCRNLACCQALRARQTHGVGSNAIDPDCGDDLL